MSQSNNSREQQYANAIAQLDAEVSAEKTPRLSARQNHSAVILRDEEEATAIAKVATLRKALAYRNPNDSTKLQCQIDRDNAFLLNILAQGSSAERDYVIRSLYRVVRKRVEKSLSGSRGTSAVEEELEKQTAKERAEATSGSDVQPEVNSTLGVIERKAATRLGAKHTDNLQNVDVAEMTEHSLADALVDLYDDSIVKDWTRLLPSIIGNLAYNGFRRYLRRTRFDRHYDDLSAKQTAKGEILPSLWLEQQPDYEYEVIPVEVRLHDLLKIARKEFLKKNPLHKGATTEKGITRAKLHNVSVERRWAMLQVMLTDCFYGRSQSHSQGSAGEKASQRTKALLRELAQGSDSLREALAG